MPSGVLPKVFLSCSFFGAFSSIAFNSTTAFLASSDVAAWIDTFLSRKLLVSVLSIEEEPSISRRCSFAGC